MYSLETPESVAVRYDVAGVGSRFLAALLDTFIQGLILVALFIVIGVGSAILSGTASYVVFAVGILIINVVLFGYYVFFEIVWNGQSPGKRAMGLRVIQTSGYPVTVAAVLIRNVLRLVDFLPSFYAVGVITMIANRHSRRLGDLVAGTIVVKERRDGSLASLPYTPLTTLQAPSRTPVAPWSPMSAEQSSGVSDDAISLIATGAQPERLTRADEALVRDFLQRRGALAQQRRDELARQIAAVVHNRIGGATPLYGPMAPERYLEIVLATHDSGGTGRSLPPSAPS